MHLVSISRKECESPTLPSSPQSTLSPSPQIFLLTTRAFLICLKIRVVLQFTRQLVAPYKGIRFLKSRKFLLVESGIREILASGIRHPELKIRNTAQGIRNPSNDWIARSSSSTLIESGIHYLESKIHGLESKIQNCLGFPHMEREAPNEDTVQNHLNIALLNVFWYLNGRYRHIFIP